MGIALKTCSTCGKNFAVKFRRQVQRKNGIIYYFCSNECAENDPKNEQNLLCCTVCNNTFEPLFVYQQAKIDNQSFNFCSITCRKKVTEPYSEQLKKRHHVPVRIAVLNQKGGTGKTTTAVTVAAGLAAEGAKVLIIDVDVQGHVGISLGIDTEIHKTIYHIIVENESLDDVKVEGRPNLDVVVGNTTLATCEIVLARMEEERDTMLREKLAAERDYDFIILDCGPSLSLINLNALTFADWLLIPVSCDFLSLVGVRQVLRTLKKVNQVLLHPIDIIGILPTLYDMRNNVSVEAVRDLKSHFGDKVLSPIRVNTRLKEAPKMEQTIFEYAPDSRGATDYKKIVMELLAFKERRDKRYEVS